jgi:hypothetical protein
MLPASLYPRITIKRDINALTSQFGFVVFRHCIFIYIYRLWPWTVTSPGLALFRLLFYLFSSPFFLFLFHWQPAVLNIVEQVKLRVKVDKMFTCHRRHNVNLDYKIVKLQVNFLSWLCINNSGQIINITSRII